MNTQNLYCLKWVKICSFPFVGIIYSLDIFKMKTVASIMRWVSGLVVCVVFIMKWLWFSAWTQCNIRPTAAGLKPIDFKWSNLRDQYPLHTARDQVQWDLTPAETKPDKRGQNTSLDLVQLFKCGISCSFVTDFTEPESHVLYWTICIEFEKKWKNEFHAWWSKELHV